MVVAGQEDHHHAYQVVWGRKRPRFWCGALIFAVLFLWATPKFHHSPNHHLLADMRNFLGVPNTLNVISTFPLLVFGILGLVLCLHGNCFRISMRGEVLGWTFFYAGIAASAFGSAYYHLKPDDVRALWDRLPMMIAVTSLLSILVIERLNEQLGVTCFILALVLVLISNAYERTFNDLRLVFIFYFVPCMAIPVLAFMFPPKYTHSIYWFWAAGFYLLAEVEYVADKKVYRFNQYVISGHSLGHLCVAMVPVMFTIMLLLRNLKVMRICSHRLQGFIKEEA